MKKLMIIALSLFVLSSCQKETIQPEQPQTTTGKLSISILYKSVPVTGAEIGLTKDNSTDNEDLFLLIKTTDENGKVIFSDLDPGEYFWQIKFPEDSEYDAIGGNPRRFIDFEMGSYEVTAGGNLGGPVFIN